MIDIHDLHWQAGIFEGEGSVRINCVLRGPNANQHRRPR